MCLGHIIISKIFGNNKYYLKNLRLDLFAKFYDILDHSVIIESWGTNVIL